MLELVYLYITVLSLKIFLYTFLHFPVPPYKKISARLLPDLPGCYLGLTITDNMDWGQHISEISSEATKTLG